MPGSGVTKVSPLTAPCAICNVTDNGIDESDSIQHHNASAGKRPLEQCRTTGICDVDHAAGEGEPAGNSSQGTGGKAYCSARYLTDIVNSKESEVTDIVPPAVAGMPLHVAVPAEVVPNVA